MTMVEYLTQGQNLLKNPIISSANTKSLPSISMLINMATTTTTEASHLSGKKCLPMSIPMKSIFQVWPRLIQFQSTVWLLILLLISLLLELPPS